LSKCVDTAADPPRVDIHATSTSYVYMTRHNCRHRVTLLTRFDKTAT